MATVELRHIWKKYGDVEAVRDLSLTCKDGEFLCLLGPSGLRQVLHHADGGGTGDGSPPATC